MDTYLLAKNNGTLLDLLLVDEISGEYHISYKQFDPATGQEIDPKTEVVYLPNLQSQLDNLQELLTDCEAQV